MKRLYAFCFCVLCITLIISFTFISDALAKEPATVQKVSQPEFVEPTILFIEPIDGAFAKEKTEEELKLDEMLEEYGLKLLETNDADDIDKDFFAKLLYCEAGNMDWYGRLFTASAILNFCEHNNVTMWEAGHKVNWFSVAPYVDNAKPNQETIDTVEYVLDGHRISDVTYFQCGGYHKFGTKVCQVGAHYFSKP